ncbi:SAC3/GANP domain protein [Polychytrium aggregatum]|uniref:SAC3/GANP domain protein n=1 Tax=Polychytrium aggregatum TaxID=110093 RepID=UPI0022FEA099|nr:SAC3/GANP domain protein [Polychytrium aggregatum]KAI9199434.1 SAC3/GANP domain protein [Polychytrium aggregatum]
MSSFAQPGMTAPAQWTPEQIAYYNSPEYAEWYAQNYPQLASRPQTPPPGSYGTYPSAYSSQPQASMQPYPAYASQQYSNIADQAYQAYYAGSYQGYAAGPGPSQAAYPATQQHPSLAPPGYPPSQPAPVYAPQHSAPAYSAPQPQAPSHKPPVVSNPKKTPAVAKHTFTKPAATKPAYISVKSRPATGKVAAVFQESTADDSSSKSASSGPSESGSIPPTLRDYVNRVYSACTDGALREKANQELTALIEGINHRKAMWTTDWENMPLPKCLMDLKALPKDGGSPVAASSPSPASSKKRKKHGVQDANKSFESPKLTTKDFAPSVEDFNEQTKREQRAKRFQESYEQEKRQTIQNQTISKRAKMAAISAGAEGNPDVIDWDEHTIVGTSTQLEKRYLRLTSAPDPATVRPLHILKQTLELLLKKWRSERNYTYICDQFKSLRQDLTVQRIKNEFTVTVYEMHARIALEKSDLGEYNQCQAQLKQLYEHGLPGHVDEFMGYRILYFVHTINRQGLFNAISSLTDAQKASESVRHALAVRSSIAIGNYRQLFRLYLEAPNMSGYLMDQFIDRERIRAMKVICKAFRPDIPVQYLTQVLGFSHPDNEAPDDEETRSCRQWLILKGCIFASNNDYARGDVDAKLSNSVFAELEKANSSKGVDIKGQIH